MRRLAAVLVVLAGAGTAHAQARLPVIAGNGLVNVLVEIDGTVKTWGDPARLDPSPPLGNGIRASDQREVKTPTAPCGAGARTSKASFAMAPPSGVRLPCR